MNSYAHFYKYFETLDELKYNLIKRKKDLPYNMYLFDIFCGAENRKKKTVKYVYSEILYSRVIDLSTPLFSGQ